jgi:predicted nucleotidyltransferase
MVRKEVKRVVNYLNVLLKEKAIVADKIIVFGSQASGNFNKDSDIDIAIISKNFKGRDIFSKAKMLNGIHWKLVEKFMMPLDIITMSPEEFKKGTSLVSQFVRNGEVVYSKRKNQSNKITNN